MSKKKELSPELKAECEAAKSLFASRKNARGLTQAKLAAEADISPAAVAMYLNAVNPLNAKFASVLARLIDVTVESFSPRLAKEIGGMASAIEGHPQRLEGSAVAEQASLLDAVATPRSREILARIAKAARDGLLTEADLTLLDQIAARLEGANKAPKQHHTTSHKRLRDKLTKNGSSAQ